MPRAAFVAVVIMGTLMGGVTFALAESRPIEQLPADVVRWSTVWVAIPQQIYEVGQEHGPLAALTWGPTKGTAVLIESTTKELWGAMKPDQRPGHRSKGKGPSGLIFRYEF